MHSYGKCRFDLRTFWLENHLPIRIKFSSQDPTVYQKDLHVPENPDSVVADLEPDILESEVKSALESMANNKASGGDGIPVELLKT